ncbi:MAG: hypothetical protein M0R33_18750 [Methylomonas sp.]|jgi:thiol-disulfide isomerase/thioredoxin|uniref:hypothetical protein n=1 Tax=Methylomonas sp. TaxID=418 RepID=UPI0025E1EC87|nr:hypothetical protein [Methylomonas sp.]MCK9608484.1 hypothetical protein [Methylomonas sp.]
MTLYIRSQAGGLLFLLSVIFICATAKPAKAEDFLHPFEIGSLEKIQSAYAGRPFLLILWSIDCPPCHKELELVGAVKKRHPDLQLVLISTDSAEVSEQVESVLASHRLANADAWIFSGGNDEHLRYVIDPSWFGEMPRSYFYDSKHNRVGVSGALKKEQIETWLTSPRVAPPRKTGI